MNTRKLVASSLTALMIVAGNAVAEEQAPAPFPSSAREVGGHWSGKVGRDSTPGMDIAIYPTAGREFSSLSNVAWPGRDAQYSVRTGGKFVGTSMREYKSAVFPSAAREFSSLGY